MMKIQNPNFKAQNKSQPEDPKSQIFWIWKLGFGIYFGFWILSFGFSAVALDNPEKALTDVIEDYVMTTYPDWIGYDIKISLKYADKAIDYLREIEGDVDLRVVEVYRDFKPVGNVIFPIEVATDTSRERVFVRAQVEVFKNVVIANRRIKRGEEITPEDLALESRDISVVPQKYFEDIAQVADTEARTSIPKNSTIYEWMIKEIPLVHRGDEVAILVTGPNLTVKTMGRALEDGYLGKMIKVKRLESDKTLEGFLVSPTEVEVRLK